MTSERVKVRPERFTMVDFEAATVAAAVARVADLVGLPADVTVSLEIDESSPFGATASSIEGRCVHLAVEGGAFEDPHRLRQFSESRASLVLGRLLLRAADRLDPAFGVPPPDAELGFARHTLWDTYAAGRFSRLSGVDAGRARRRYAFRLRHGFTDAVDSAFDRVWSAEGLTWADLEAAGEDALSAGRGR